MITDARQTILDTLKATGHLRSVYSVDQAAKVLGLSRSKAYEEVAAGTIPSTEIAGRRRLTVNMVVDYLLDREQNARSKR